MRPVAITGIDTIHFTTGPGVGAATLCGRQTVAPVWEDLQDHEVEDALPGCLCRACKRTTAWRNS